MQRTERSSAKMSALTAAPEMMLIDVNMPVMDGIATAAWLQQQYPAVKMVALSMNDDDKTIIGMIKAGCCAYLLKDTHPDELEKALDEIYQKGYYNADAVNVNYRRLLLAQQEQEQLVLTQREKDFLKLACSDLTYKQIAAEMFLAERTIDGYRETLLKIQCSKPRWSCPGSDQKRVCGTLTNRCGILKPS